MKFAVLRSWLPNSGAVSDHSRRRISRVGLTGLLTLLARGMTVGVGLVTLPFASYYLGKERFGVWITLSSVIAWIMVADLGLTGSLINALSTADGNEDRQTAQRAVSSAFWLVLMMAGAVILIFVPLLPFIPWPRFFNVGSPQAIAEVTPAVIVVFILSALRLPTLIVNCVYQAYQEGYLYQLWSGASGLLAAFGLVAAIKLQAGLPWLVVAFLGGMLLADLFSAIYLFRRRREWLMPLPRYFDWSQAKWLLQRGAQFWIAQMSTMLLLQTDLFVVSLMFGAGATAGYGTALRLYALVGAVQSAFIMPLWAAYGEALARGDVEWISSTFKRSILLSVVWSALVACALLVAMPLLFRWLVTPDVQASVHLRLAMTVTEVINSITRCIAVLLSGLGVVRTLVFIGPLSGLTNIALSILLGSFIGLPGVAWATATCLLIFWVGLAGRGVRRQLEVVKA